MPELPEGASRHCTTSQDHGLEQALDNTLIQLSEGALRSGDKVRLDLPVRNVNRTVGTMLGYEVTKRWGGDGLPDDTIDVTLTGSAGQSFGAFLPRGVTLRLIGDTQRLLRQGPVRRAASRCARTPRRRSWPRRTSSPATCILYGATSGEVFVRGVVGERFCVRNSGALAVVEGVGDHGCEYMTGGRVGRARPDRAQLRGRHVRRHRVRARRPASTGSTRRWSTSTRSTRTTARCLRDAVERHHAETGSAVAHGLLTDWDDAVDRFVKVMPKDFKRVLQARAAAERDGRDVNEAIMEAAHG